MSKPSTDACPRRRGTVAAAVLAALLAAGCASTPSAPDADEPAAQTKESPKRPPVSPEAEAAFQRGLALLDQGQASDAAAVFLPLSEQQPDLPGPLVNLAIAYIHLDRQQEAEAALQQALESVPDHPEALNQLAILYRQSGRFEEAEAAYQRLLAAHPEYRFAHLNLGILCDLYLQRPDCALSHYQRYQELGPKPDPEVANWILDLERRLPEG